MANAIPRSQEIKTKTKHVYSSTRISLKPTDHTEIEELIRELKNKKASGLYGISNEILKITSNFVCQPISYIINSALDKGKVTHRFKKAVIKPIYNSGDRYLVSNYRPISFISSVAKLFERAVKNRIVYSGIDHKKSCLGVFVDLAKAFDTVNHRLLIDKLECLGIRGIALDLFESYLKDRK